MNMLEIVKTRRSVRTFDGKPLTKEDLEKYQDNPEHKAVGQSFVRPYVKERRVLRLT